MTTMTLSKTVQDFYNEFPELEQYITQQQAKGNFPAAYTPTIIDVNFLGLTYIRYEHGEITLLRPCAKDYKPLFMEVCFDEEESALFILPKSKEVLLDRTDTMAQLDALLDQCQFLDKAMLGDRSQ